MRGFSRGFGGFAFSSNLQIFTTDSVRHEKFCDLFGALPAQVPVSLLGSCLVGIAQHLEAWNSADRDHSADPLAQFAVEPVSTVRLIGSKHARIARKQQVGCLDFCSQ